MVPLASDPVEPKEVNELVACRSIAPNAYLKVPELHRKRVFWVLIFQGHRRTKKLTALNRVPRRHEAVPRLRQKRAQGHPQHRALP